MTTHPEFGTTLAWLLSHRGLGVGELADRAGSVGDEVLGVLAGERPRGELLRRLAPALGFRTVDLFVLAGLEVPEDLAPLDAGAAVAVAHLVTDAAVLPAAGRRELLRLVRALPQEERRVPYAPPWTEPPGGGPGARCVRMLRYRCLNLLGVARTLAYVTPSYLSASTYGLLGAGRTELTPRLVTDFAALLGIDARELAGLTGVLLREEPPPASAGAVDAAALLWEGRRLSAAQAEYVSEVAHSLRRRHR